MANKVYLNKNDIIEIEVIGDQTVSSVGAMVQLADTLITGQKSIGKPCLVLDNLLQIGKVDVQARKLVVDLGGR